MNKLRLQYSKTGRAKYISHLDLMATMQRAFIRAGTNLKYSEGFNPHPYMSVALPLSVGCESVCELIDVGIADDIIPDISSILLPDGITILRAYKANRKFNEIAWIEISGKMLFNEKVTSDRMADIEKKFFAESIIISKRTKRGNKELDLAPYLKNFVFKGTDEDCENILFSARIHAQNPSINAADLMNVIDEKYKPDFIAMKRIAIYDTDMIEFL